MGVSPGKKSEVALIFTDDKIKTLFNNHKKYLTQLAAAEPIVFTEGDAPDNALSAALSGVTLYLPLSGLIDVEKETTRLNKELDGIKSDIKRAEGKLNNKGFVAKAPANVVENERVKLKELKEKESATIQRLKDLEKLR